jgi:predicted RNase H-like HicB family nuclease
VAPRYVLSDYVGEAMAQAAFEKLEDGSYAGRIPSCAGVVAFGASLRKCGNELRSTLEDWILHG